MSRYTRSILCLSHTSPPRGSSLRVSRDLVSLVSRLSSCISYLSSLVPLVSRLSVSLVSLCAAPPDEDGELILWGAARSAAADDHQGKRAVLSLANEDEVPAGHARLQVTISPIASGGA